MFVSVALAQQIPLIQQIGIFSFVFQKAGYTDDEFEKGASNVFYFLYDGYVL